MVEATVAHRLGEQRVVTRALRRRVRALAARGDEIRAAELQPPSEQTLPRRGSNPRPHREQQSQHRWRQGGRGFDRRRGDYLGADHTEMLGDTAREHGVSVAAGEDVTVRREGVRRSARTGLDPRASG